jgi:hypothetical protein
MVLHLINWSHRLIFLGTSATMMSNRQFLLNGLVSIIKNVIKSPPLPFEIVLEISIDVS